MCPSDGLSTALSFTGSFSRSCPFYQKSVFLIERKQQAIEMLCVNTRAPEDHLLRKIGAAVDFACLYDLAVNLCCEDNGGSSLDPTALFKLVLVHEAYFRCGGKVEVNHTERNRRRIGVLHKGKHKKCFTVCDKRGYVLRNRGRARQYPRQYRV